MNLNKLFSEKLNVVNVGLESFSKELKEQEIDVVQVDWRPPAGDNKVQNALNWILNQSK